ncbi:MAG TPA: Ppx/GppA phosphatase family protein, partial [Caulobacteraceae bacterium]|nr:Ppx/GppA phosphatase family protein [Caulobacteraceae bacterium]
MAQAPSAPPEASRFRGRPPGEPQAFAALDLGTNNCRLLVATPSARGFRIIDAYSRIVRLGEGLSQTGRLSDDAMARAIGALRVCADKIRRRGVTRVRAIATQACRSAENGPEFLDQVAAETGLRLSIITPREEAQLSVAGCLNLLDRETDAALVLDVGGGSTELSWIDLKAPGLNVDPRRMAHWRLPIKAWLSVPIGVVTLAERFPEGEPHDLAWYRHMVEAVKCEIDGFPHADPLRPAFADGRAHLVGTSGAITSLAGLHLGLARYDRARVDGLWMTRAECETVAAHLASLTPRERAAQPCIGPDRADLVLAGAAILQAVQELWPCERVRVADRGLREGLLLSLMSEQRRRRGRRRRGP